MMLMTKKTMEQREKTTCRLQSLEKLYSEDKYPKQNKMEEYASSLNLTYHQIHGWFAERRRKDRRKNEALHSSIKSFPSSSSNAFKHTHGKCLNLSGHRRTAGTSRCAIKKMNQLVRQKCRYKDLEQLMKSHSGGRSNYAEKNHIFHLQILFPEDHILKKIFCKHGPVLGIEIDPPGDAFGHSTEFEKLQSCHDNQRIPRRSKVSQNFKTLPEVNFHARKYGMGKGLMTVWHATRPNGQKRSTVMSCTDRSSWMNVRSHVSHKATSSYVLKRLQQREPCMVNGLCLFLKIQVPSKQDAIQQEPHLRDFNLSLDESFEQSSEPRTLVDDEELELEELQEGPNPLRCSTHLASNGRHGCSLCKDLLARFPPQTVKMKQLFCTRPWDSSPGLVKQLFKVTDFCPDMRTFTLDEFAQAFHDKDSLLLGIHVALLKLLMLNVEKETTAGFITPSSKICRFLVFLDFVKQDFEVDHWKQSLGPLTWTEILWQVLVAAGFGSKQKAIQRGNYNEERNPMEKYGLHPPTLKGDIFCLLSKQGNRGLKVSELARAS
ncbi:unnamed protein product [Musa acuminata subsp. malaccensis]|nr:unnamed protein product [Musa acuminata subsp. malaccensis]